MPSLAALKEKPRWVAAVFFFISGIISASWASRIPDMQQRLRLNDAEWGAVLFALPAGLVVGLPLSSWLVSKYSSRRTMVFASMLFAAMLFIVGLSQHTLFLIFSLFLFGVLRNATNISINTHSMEVQGLYEKPIVATFHGIWSLACFVAAGIGTLMIAINIGLTTQFLLVAIFIIVLSFLFKIEKFKSYASAERRPFFIKPDKYLLLLGLIAFCSMICEATMFDWSVNYFHQVIKADEKLTTSGYTAFIIAMAIGRLTGDKIVGLYGAATVLIVNGVVMALGFLVAILFPYFLPACIGFLLIGLGDSIVVPTVYVFAAKTKKMSAAYAIASVTIVGYAGFLLGPLIVGSISEAFGMQWAFGLMGLLSIGITAITLLVKKQAGMGKRS